MTYSEQMAIAVARKVHKRWCGERTPCEYGYEDMQVARDILDGLVAEGFATPDSSGSDDDGWGATNGQRRYCEGYDAAVRRLRALDGHHTAARLAQLLEDQAPDPDDPWADAGPARVSAEERSDDTKAPSKITEVG